MGKDKSCNIIGGLASKKLSGHKLSQLMLACFLGEKDMVNSCINEGAEPNQKNDRDNTALHYVCMQSKNLQKIVSTIGDGITLENNLNDDKKMPFDLLIDQICAISQKICSSQQYQQKLAGKNHSYNCSKPYNTQEKIKKLEERKHLLMICLPSS